MAGYDIESLKKGKNGPGNTGETTDSASSEAGLYRHPETGAEIATRFDPLTQNAQSEAAIRIGFVRVGDVPTDYEKQVQIVDKNSAGALDSTRDSLLIEAMAEIQKLKEDAAKRDAPKADTKKEEKSKKEDK